MAFDRNEAADVAFGHRPVLLDECMEGLNIRPDGIYLDGTLVRAGHSWEIVRRLTAGGRLIGLDRDETALEAARRRLAPYIDRVTLVHSNFSCVAQVLDQLNVPAVDGMIFAGRVLSPAGRRPAGLLLHARRSPGHAHGPHRRPDGPHRGQRMAL